MIVHNGNVVVNNGRWIIPTKPPEPDPYNPLNLPPYTIRLKYKDGITPSFTKGTGIQLSSSPNIWDLTYNKPNWGYILDMHSNLLEVLGANTTGVNDMECMFYGCSSLTSVSIFDTSMVTNMANMFGGHLHATVPITNVPLFDTSNVTDMHMMFANCSNLVSVPLFNTSKVTDMSWMFSACRSITSVPLFDTSNVTNMYTAFNYCISLKYVPLLNTSKVTNMEDAFRECHNVESGALALYNQASSQTNPPSNHAACFYDCGDYTISGSAELAQIPSGWKTVY